MNWIDYLKRLLGKQGVAETLPEGYCPNCWGEQEYEGQVREVLIKNHIDLNNVEQNLGWIEAYVIEHFEGIKMKDEEGSKVCPSCQKSHVSLTERIK